MEHDLILPEPLRDEELLAENHFTITKTLFVEARLALSGDGYRKTARKLSWVLLALLAGLVAGSLLLGLSPFSVGMEVLILSVMVFWLRWGLPRSSAKTAYKALVRSAGEPPERDTRFYAGRLEIHGPGVDTALDYSQIRQVLRTKHLLILVSDEGGGVLLKPDAFTQGDEALVRRLVGE